ncbi:MAG: hypothetical protein ACREMA_13465 [Longimicrobiales bacterium]
MTTDLRIGDMRTIIWLLAFVTGCLPSVACAQAQPYRTARFAAGPLNAVVIFQDANVARREPELQSLLRGAFSRYHEFFGGPPRGPTGSALDTVTVSLASAPVGEGDANPGTVRIVVGEHPVFGFYDWRLLLLHETFHLWSAHSFRYASAAEQWFNEGVSEFYAAQTAARLDLIDPLRAVGVTATALGFYVSAPQLGAVALMKAANTTQSKFQNYFLVYYGGWMAGLVLDHDIRTRTNGQRSLDDVMRRMYRSFDRQRLYTTADVVAEIRTVTGIDYTHFFEQHIRGPAAIPVSQHLSLGNLAFALTARAANARASAIDAHLLASLGLDPVVR